MQTAAQSPGAGPLVTGSDASLQSARVRLEFLAYVQH